MGKYFSSVALMVLGFVLIRQGESLAAWVGGAFLVLIGVMLMKSSRQGLLDRARQRQSAENNPKHSTKESA